MYRFNGHDQRLDRMLEAVLMVMEAFSKQERKFKVPGLLWAVKSVHLITLNFIL